MNASSTPPERRTTLPRRTGEWLPEQGIVGAWLATLLAALAGCELPNDAVRDIQAADRRAETFSEAPLLVDATAAAGIDFAHWNGMVGKNDFAENMGSGGALFDADGDGDLDLYFVQGAALRGRSYDEALHPPPGEPPIGDRFYRNETPAGGSPRFVDATAEAGDLGTGYGMGVAAGDVDNDGDVDLYVTNDGANQLLLGHGDGSFEDATDGASTGDPRLSVPAVFLDVDRDGWLDLFIGNYVSIPHPPPTCRDTTGGIDYCGPANFAPQGDRLLGNRGRDRRGVWLGFEDVTESAGLGGVRAPALGAVAADFDLDGRVDLYVANDGHPNQLWMNRGGQGEWRLVDEALLAGSALDAGGRAEASMGVEAADFDSDGDLDLFMTHLIAESNTLYRNDGHGMFHDASAAAGIAAPSRPFTTFGAGALDLGNDGVLDLIVVSGAVNNLPERVRLGDPYPLGQADQLLLGRGDGTFEDATARALGVLGVLAVSRGLILGDVDQDGDADIVITNNQGPARLLLDPRGQDRAWIGFDLRLDESAGSRSALGARVALEVAEGPLVWQRVGTDGSYASARDPRVRLGLGDDTSPQTVQVVWPDGIAERFAELVSGRYHVLIAGAGQRIEDDDVQ